MEKKTICIRIAIYMFVALVYIVNKTGSHGLLPSYCCPAVYYGEVAVGVGSSLYNVEVKRWIQINRCWSCDSLLKATLSHLLIIGRKSSLLHKGGFLMMIFVVWNPRLPPVNAYNWSGPLCHLWCNITPQSRAAERVLSFCCSMAYIKRLECLCHCKGFVSPNMICADTITAPSSCIIPMSVGTKFK